MASPSPVLLDDVLPEWHHRERHALHVGAPSERVLRAVREVTLGEMPVVRPLLWLRGIRASRTRPIVEEALDGFRIAAEEPDRELVLASIGQPWRWTGGERRRDDLGTFDEPGYAKMALNFRHEGGVLTTETRVLLTDTASRRKFRAYWLLIRPFSGLIRLAWLRAVRARAYSSS